MAKKEKKHTMVVWAFNVVSSDGLTSVSGSYVSTSTDVTVDTQVINYLKAHDADLQVFWRKVCDKAIADATAGNPFTLPTK